MATQSCQNNLVDISCAYTYRRVRTIKQTWIGESRMQLHREVVTRDVLRHVVFAHPMRAV